MPKRHPSRSTSVLTPAKGSLVSALGTRCRQLRLGDPAPSSPVNPTCPRTYGGGCGSEDCGARSGSGSGSEALTPLTTTLKLRSANHARVQMSFDPALTSSAAAVGGSATSSTDAASTTGAICTRGSEEEDRDERDEGREIVVVVPAVPCVAPASALDLGLPIDVVRSRSVAFDDIPDGEERAGSAVAKQVDEEEVEEGWSKIEEDEVRQERADKGGSLDAMGLGNVGWIGAVDYDQQSAAAKAARQRHRPLRTHSGIGIIKLLTLGPLGDNMSEHDSAVDFSGTLDSNAPAPLPTEPGYVGSFLPSARPLWPDGRDQGLGLLASLASNAIKPLAPNSNPLAGAVPSFIAPEKLGNVLAASSVVGPDAFGGNLRRFVACAAGVQEDDVVRVMGVVRRLCDSGLSRDFVLDQLIAKPSTVGHQLDPPLQLPPLPQPSLTLSPLNLPQSLQPTSQQTVQQSLQQQLPPPCILPYPLLSQPLAQHELLQQQPAMMNLSNLLNDAGNRTGSSCSSNSSSCSDFGSGSDSDEGGSQPAHGDRRRSQPAEDCEIDEECLADPTIDILKVPKNPDTGRYHCPYVRCKYEGAVRRYNLKMHYATHLGDLSRTNKCGRRGCRMTFRRRYDLDRHGVCVHGMTPREALANGGPRPKRVNGDEGEKALIARLQRLIEERRVEAMRRKVKKDMRKDGTLNKIVEDRMEGREAMGVVRTKDGSSENRGKGRPTKHSELEDDGEIEEQEEEEQGDVDRTSKKRRKDLPMCPPAAYQRLAS
ncbi:hypothetical protein HK101_000773 [Irineochytrium annulatum]|nr:hypothetical protein HK101_000773 [Irineochytrium annulatum]